MTDKYPYRDNFRLKLAALVLDPLWTGRVGRIIKPEYFETDAEQEAVAAIYMYRDTYNKTPHDPEDVAVYCESDAAVDMVYDIFDHKHDDMEMPKDVAVQWAKEQAVKIAILESIDNVKRGNLADVVARLQEAVSVGENINSPGIDFVKDISTWLYDLWTDKISTGFVHIDNHLEGGLGAGELGIVLAPTNRGKSVALVNIAYGAAGLLSGKNVAIFTHEMEAEKYAKRVAARMMFKFPDRYGDLSKYEDDVITLASRLLPGNIRIIGGAKKMSVLDLQDAVSRMTDEGYKPDVIIDDYADLLIPPKSYGDKRFELTSIYEWLRSFGGDIGCPIWTASQVGRQAYTREVIRISDIAEDIGKANTADVIMAICQTDEEAKQDRCRLFLPKVRDAKHNMMYDAKYYTSSQSIITIGETQSRDIEDV